jgi:hypothetical protein
MSFDESPHLEEDTIKQFAQFDLGLVRCISAIYAKDIERLQAVSQEFSTVFLKDESTTLEFIFWLVSQYAVVFQELVNESDFDIEQILMDRELFSIHVLENPSVFNQTFPDLTEDLDGEAQE